MPNVTIDWQGGWRFLGADSAEMQVVIDGQQQVGAKPSDLLPLSLAACSATDLVEVLSVDQSVDLEAINVSARYTQQPEPPHGFQRIRLHYTLTGSGLTDEKVEEAIRRSEEEMCSVAASLRGNVKLSSTFEITAPADPATADSTTGD